MKKSSVDMSRCVFDRNVAAYTYDEDVGSINQASVQVLDSMLLYSYTSHRLWDRDDLSVDTSYTSDGGDRVAVSSMVRDIDEEDD